eukprot:Gregarina_sp_Poly_1__5055@NODE_267_length_10370_cov_226_463457_g233_i0_p5_GENE_NODE_267_length_10370_cov_226_463457_g233_i0NODE_267_length_10370_cov_226_463457_g233_i0_p5_ORF_typecomplete_len280_score52_63IR1M/PF12185_8/0_015DUF3349/PF11829_8/0_65DUF3349/PF11829_8/9e03DUF3349/PF11829_8/6e03_NODE_267_length_10370_cov_226_463457_g233_i02811120
MVQATKNPTMFSAEQSIQTIKQVRPELDVWVESISTLLGWVQKNPALTRKSRDSLLAAETVLYIHSLECLLRFLKDALIEGIDAENHLAILRLSELKCTHEKIDALATKCQGRWDKLLKSTSAEAIDNNKQLRARPELFVTGAGEDKENLKEKGKSGLYQAPKTFALEYTKDSEKREEEDLQKEQERLRQSEFVRAITADLLPTPEIVGDGHEELDAASRKLLRKYKVAEEFHQETMTTPKRRKVDEARYRQLKAKQGLLTVGSTLDDLNSFVSRINKP